MAAGISWFFRGRLTSAWLCQHCNPPEVWPWLSALEIPLTRYFLSHFTEIPSKLSKQSDLAHVTWMLKRPSGLPSVSAWLKTHFVLRAGIMWKAQSTSLEVFPQQLKPNRNKPPSLVCAFNLLITPQGPWNWSQAKKWEVTAYPFSAFWKSPPFPPNSTEWQKPAFPLLLLTIHGTEEMCFLLSLFPGSDTHIACLLHF